MRKWEDIIKDKMEEPEGALPESVFAEFRARREAAAAAPKRFSLAWAVVLAAAAGLAAVLLLHKPSVPQGDIQPVQQPSASVAVVADTISVNEPDQTTPLIAQVVIPKIARNTTAKPQQMVENETDNKPAEEYVPATPEEATANPQTTETNATGPVEETVAKESEITTSSPFIPERKEARKVSLKVVPAVGIIAGGGLLAAVAAPLLGTGPMKAAVPDMEVDPYHGGIIMNPDDQKDERTGDAIHYFPLKVGLSARIPISERLSVTTGLDYSWYRSCITYSLSGQKVQNAHYLGIPVRLDWTFASNRWLDVYLGGGLEGNYCLGATLAGKRVAKDGFSASLLGAGGIQFKITENWGVYVEPELSWTFAPKNLILESYQTKYPLMFSVTSGLRITIGK